MAGDRESPGPLTEAEDMINGGRNSPGLCSLLGSGDNQHNRQEKRTRDDFSGDSLLIGTGRGCYGAQY